MIDEIDTKPAIGAYEGWMKACLTPYVEGQSMENIQPSGQYPVQPVPLSEYSHMPEVLLQFDFMRAHGTEQKL